MNEYKGKSINELMTENNAQAIKELAKDIDRVESKIGNNKLREDIFVNVFLPFFSGVGENIYNVGLGNWERVAGDGGVNGLYREVDIIDENNKVIYSVPPIYERSGIRPVLISDRISFRSLIDQAQLLGHIKPSLATSKTNEIYSALRNKMTDKQASQFDYLKRWDEIFTRYNLPSMFEVKNNNTNQSSDTTDGLDYEIEEL